MKLQKRAADARAFSLPVFLKKPGNEAGPNKGGGGGYSHNTTFRTRVYFSLTEQANSCPCYTLSICAFLKKNKTPAKAAKAKMGTTPGPGRTVTNWEWVVFIYFCSFRRIPFETSCYKGRFIEKLV